jgi:hypothetical protein
MIDILAFDPTAIRFCRLPHSQDDNWRARESAVLALGAISDGCHRGLSPYIGDLVLTSSA